MDSIRVYCPATYPMRKIIVCDGFSTQSERNQQGVARKGRRITEEKASDYKEYISRIQNHIKQGDPAFHNAETLVLPKLHGFGLAMREALRLVRTPYVFVAQHDRAFSQKGQPLAPLVKILDTEAKVNYLGYLTHRQVNYISRMMSQNHLRIEPEEVQGLKIAPLIHFLDSMHVARVSLWEYMFETGSIKVRDFPEHTFGNLQRWDVLKNGWKAFAKYGTYLIWDANVCVKHVNGRTFLDAAQRERKGFPALSTFAELQRDLKAQEKENEKKGILTQPKRRMESSTSQANTNSTKCDEKGEGAEGGGEERPEGKAKVGTNKTTNSSDPVVIDKLVQQLGNAKLNE